jgi:hypothetical protein
MRNELLIAECAFGWGQMFQLYQYYLDVDGTRYPLSELTHVSHTYHRVLGITSARIELRFGKKKVMLRGIAAIEDAQRAITYLTAHYLGLPQTNGINWDSNGDEENSFGEQGVSDCTHQFITPSNKAQEKPFPSAFPPETQVELEEYSPITTEDMLLQEHTQAPTAKVETPGWRRWRVEQRERRQKRLHAERMLREHGFDVAELAQRLKEEPLPAVAVPVRLLTDEQAHYTTDATLCGEPVGGTIRYIYPAKDQGRLILTNRRLIYMGRKSQLVLDYARLLHISRLRGALAFQAEHWQKREIFEVRRPLECAMYLERILEQFHQEQQLQAITGDYAWKNPGDEVNTMPLSQYSWEMIDQ